VWLCTCLHYRTCGVYIVSWLMHHGLTLAISNDCAGVPSAHHGHKEINFAVQQVRFAAFVAEGTWRRGVNFSISVPGLGKLLTLLVPQVHCNDMHI
jgi:hypothetical protein